MKRKVVKAWISVGEEGIEECPASEGFTLCVHKENINDNMVRCTITYELPRKARKK